MNESNLLISTHHTDLAACRAVLAPKFCCSPVRRSVADDVARATCTYVCTYDFKDLVHAIHTLVHVQRLIILLLRSKILRARGK